MVRYERAAPGELIHIDTKKLGKIDGIGHRITGNRRGQKRGIGWDLVHVCVDDASRLAYTEVLPDEKKVSACAFLTRALAFFARHGVTVSRVMTDNGSAYRSRDFRHFCATAASDTSAPGHIRQGPMARRSASSRPRSASGPTPEPTNPPPSEPWPWRHGSTSTIPNDHTQPSPTKPHGSG